MRLPRRMKTAEWISRCPARVSFHRAEKGNLLRVALFLQRFSVQIEQDEFGKMLPYRAQLQVDGGRRQQSGDGEGDHAVNQVAGEGRSAQKRGEAGRSSEEAEGRPAGILIQIPKPVSDKAEEHEAEHQFGHSHYEQRVPSQMPDVRGPSTKDDKRGESAGQTRKQYREKNHPNGSLHSGLLMLGHKDTG